MVAYEILVYERGRREKSMQGDFTYLSGCEEGQRGCVDLGNESSPRCAKGVQRSGAFHAQKTHWLTLIGTFFCGFIRIILQYSFQVILMDNNLCRCRLLHFEFQYVYLIIYESNVPKYHDDQ